MTYLEYKHRVEFGRDEYTEIAEDCEEHGLHWFASPWDVPSVEFLESFDVVAHKVASASITDHELLRALAATGKPIILSTGMSTIEEIDAAVEILGTQQADPHALHLHLPAAAGGGEPAHDHHAAGALRGAGRLFRARARPADLVGRGHAGRGGGGAAHHARPHHVGLGPRRLAGARRAASTWSGTSASSSRRSATV